MPTCAVIISAAITNTIALPTAIPAGLQFLSVATLPGLFELPPDMGPIDVDVNRLDNQVLVRYHETDWRRFEGRN